MRWRVVLVLGVVGGLAAGMGGCTKPNPKSCADGVCSDPAFPHCDVDATFNENVETCIAVDCEPDTFQACRDDQAITCNAAGTNFDLIQCERGCEDGVGCRLCSPNETACTNGTVATCDANGTVVATEACPLGCFEDEPRCRDIEPSNNLGQFVDMVDDPPDFDESNVVFETDTGVVRVGAESRIIPSFLAPPTGNGVAIRVFVLGEVKINSATIGPSGSPTSTVGPAFAIVARGTISITGEVLIVPRAGSATAGCPVPGDGQAFQDADDRIVSSGGGGGGNATDGAEGGAIGGIASPVTAAAKGLASGTPGLVPLRGGCSGGYTFGRFTTGGGAIQLSSSKKIEIDATINVRGTALLEQNQIGTGGGFFMSGGGAGGSILLEAPEVILGASSKLLAAGAKGAQGCSTPTAACTAGGAGATDASSAVRGSDIVSPGAGNNAFSGGGGGGLGRLRVNIPTPASLTDAPSNVEEAQLTTGTLGSR